MEPSALKRVVRFDNIPMNATYFTTEGYLIDEPVVTSTGIFEYENPDGTIRRELRLPQYVFEAASLASYEGQPIIITHRAGIIDKDNVRREIIGTILSKGRQDGNDVRAKIVIHNTDAMKNSGLKELSLGYDLELDETPGIWNGEPYDAVQTNIRINHLALVSSARAGEQARLNIDGNGGKTILEGEKEMGKENLRSDGALSAEELQKAVEEYKQKHYSEAADGEEACDTKQDGDTAAFTKKAAPAANQVGMEQKLQEIKERKDRRDAEGVPTDSETAKAVIAQQDEDIDMLLDLLEAAQAQKDFDSADCDVKTDGEDETGVDEDDTKTDSDNESQSKAMNADSIDEMVRTRVALARIGDQLHLDGLDSMGIMDAKKAIINKVRPNLRLDGKSVPYINAAFDLAVAEVHTKKDTNYQRRQIFNADFAGSSFMDKNHEGGAAAARKKMIERRNGGND